MDEKSFGTKAKEKLIENLLSVKVWVMFLIIWFPGIMVWCNKLDGDVYAGLVGGVISTIVALREGFKVSKIRDDKTDSEKINV